MNVISRIIAVLVSAALSWIGLRLGLEFSPEDHAQAQLWATAALLALYSIAHPLIRSRLVAWTGKGARVEDNVAPPVDSDRHVR